LPTPINPTRKISSLLMSGRIFKPEINKESPRGLGLKKFWVR